MKAAAYQHPRDIRIVDVEEPTLHDDGVIIRIKEMTRGFELQSDPHASVKVMIVMS